MAESWPAKVQASYDIMFNGLKVGGFEFESTSDGQGYTLNGHGKVSVLFGAFHWSGSASAGGRLARLDPRPARFNFQLKGTTKSGSTKIVFAEDRVTDAQVVPAPKPRDDRVPITPEHLKGVLDPMGAVVAITKPGSDPCSRRVPVFDGSTRFDIQLAPARQVLSASLGPGSGRAGGVVCVIRPVLVAGHTPGQAEKFMAREKALEMVLRPVPNAGGVYVPIEFAAPSTYGLVRIVAVKVTVTPAGGGEIVVKP